ncbi:MAG: HNH endonuclease, partial [Clostridiales bacterium]|nr:HNH endonuclease [Clostridiales bacterium]
MEFDPGLQIGQTLKNNELVAIFKCGNMGGMRRSKATNTLVLVSDYTKGLYHDKWIGGVLHYTGMGKIGDQDIQWAQNATLAACGQNGVDVHLFEVLDAGEYVYCGRVALVEKPYVAIQPDEDGNMRMVWMFAFRTVP